jgi:hypothetical protein
MELLKTFDENTLNYLCRAWHHNHMSFQSKSKQKHYHQKECQFYLELAEGVLSQSFRESKELVFGKLDTVIRASSLIEMVNSLIRPYLNNSKGQITQETLNLFMYYHNHRKYKSGRRGGKAPLELLLGTTLRDHWADQLIRSAGAKQQRVVERLPEQNENEGQQDKAA